MDKMYIGLDVHKNFCQATVMNRDGVKLSEKKFLTTLKELDEFLEDIDKDAEIVMEASSTWEYLYDSIEEKGYKVCLSHPLKTRAIADARIKTDRIDSETLANLLRADLIPKSYVPSKEIRDLRFIVRHRASLVSMRTEAKNKVHAILRRKGIKHEYSDLFGKEGMEFLKNMEVDVHTRFALNNYLAVIENLNSKINETSVYIESLADLPEVKLLTTIPGVGIYSAMLILSEIGDINRFPSPKKLCSYAGLVPSVYQSGSTVKYGKITKQGSSWLRWILIQSAHKTVKSPNALQRFHAEISKRKGKKIAIVATARKMLIYMYKMITLNLSFDRLDVNT